MLAGCWGITVPAPRCCGASRRRTLRRGSADPHPAVAHHLHALFGGRDSIQLGKYSKRCATARLPSRVESTPCPA